MPYKDENKRKEYMKQWRLKNPEKAKEASAQWAINNPEKAKEYYKQYHKVHDKQYKMNHIEECKKSRKKYRDSEKGKAAKKKYDDSEKGKAWSKQYRASEEVKSRNRWWCRKKRYNITQEEYNLMFKQQKGCCVICKKHQSNFKKALCVDHDHVTGKVRGLLCTHCNSILGLAKDDIKILENAVTYLKM